MNIVDHKEEVQLKVSTNFGVKRNKEGQLIFVQFFRKSGFKFKFDVYSDMEVSDWDIGNLKQIEHFQNFKWFVEVKTLNEGSTFGEKVLMKEGETRAATIMCLTQCFFAVIDKQSYKKVLEGSEVKRTKVILDFFSQHPLFSHWTKMQKLRLKDSFKLVACKRNQVIFNQGEPTSKVYIV